MEVDPIAKRFASASPDFVVGKKRYCVPKPTLSMRLCMAACAAKGMSLKSYCIEGVACEMPFVAEAITLVDEVRLFTPLRAILPEKLGSLHDCSYSRRRVRYPVRSWLGALWPEQPSGDERAECPRLSRLYFCLDN